MLLGDGADRLSLRIPARGLKVPGSFAFFSSRAGPAKLLGPGPLALRVRSAAEGLIGVGEERVGLGGVGLGRDGPLEVGKAGARLPLQGQDASHQEVRAIVPRV